jgi:nicotinamidase/pyrazinamidase
MFDKEKMILVDIDTQVGFCLPEGHLYVKDAAPILDHIRKITDFIDREAPKIFGSVDTHDYASPEFIENGGPFPPHCVKGTEDWLKIPQSRPKKFKILGVGELADDDIRKEWEGNGAIYFEKRTYSIMDNPNVKKLLNLTRGSTFVLYGVATDYCVKAAALAFREWGDVMIISDAVAAVAKDTEKKAFEELSASGVRFIELREILPL